MINEIRKQIYLGTFTLDGEYLNFNLVKTWSEIRDLGDIVYFFLYNNTVLKVGKAGGKGGFYGRVSQYKRGINADTTNKRITKIMNEQCIETVEIYCIRASRVKTKALDKLSNKVIDIEAPTNVALEAYYMQKLIEEHELIFCYQLS